MASGILGILEDIAVLMEEVATMSKMATKKTVGILADDLAVNAEKASGFVSDRELPVLWKLTKGSFLNKVIILPTIFLLNAFVPSAIVPILLCGGIYLSFEGALKIYQFFFTKSKKKDVVNQPQLKDLEPEVYEAHKIKSAIRIDFILSIEIIILALDTVIEQPLKIQIPVVSFIALLATIGVYGIVALLVRMDDVGYRLIAKNKKGILHHFGLFLIRSLPKIIRILNVVGTLAMVLVGGGIFVHNLGFLHDFLSNIPSIVKEFTIGLVAGFSFLLLFLPIKYLIKVLKK